MRLASKNLVVLLTGVIVIAWCSMTAADQPSAADCAAEADRASRGTGSTIGGVGRGAAKGAIFGAIVGNKKSVRRGAAKNDVYTSVYDACMRRY